MVTAAVIVAVVDGRERTQTVVTGVKVAITRFHVVSSCFHLRVS